VPLKVYLRYFYSFGGYKALVWILLINALVPTCQVLTDGWLAYWVAQTANATVSSNVSDAGFVSGGGARAAAHAAVAVAVGACGGSGGGVGGGGEVLVRHALAAVDDGARWMLPMTADPSTISRSAAFVRANISHADAAMMRAPSGVSLGAAFCSPHTHVGLAASTSTANVSGTDQPRSVGFFLGVYAALSVSIMLLRSAQWWTFAYGGMLASIDFHNRMVRAVFYSCVKTCARHWRLVPLGLNHGVALAVFIIDGSFLFGGGSSW
jgi:hypothetical protein